MNQDNGRTARRGARSGGAASRRQANSAMAEGVVQFAADRANEFADSLHARARQSIDRAQHSITHVNLEGVLQRAQPLLVRTGTFVRQHPLRSGLILLLVAGAAVLARTAEPNRG